MISNNKESHISSADIYYGVDFYGLDKFRQYLQYFEKNDIILDIGCGEGAFLNLLRKEGFKGIGVDVDPCVLKIARKYGLEVIQSDIFHFLDDNNNQNKFNGVMLGDVIEHFDPFFCQILLKKIIKILKNSGKLIITTPNSKCLMMNLGSFYENEIQHHNLYSVSAIKRFLEQERMNVISHGIVKNSFLPIFIRSPLGTLRNIALWFFGRILCGKECFYSASFIVATKK